MRGSTLLSSIFFGAALVRGAPKSPCVCPSLATTTTTSTTTIYDRTANVKSTTTIPTTLDGNTKTVKLVSTVEVDYTTLLTQTSTVITTVTVDPSSLAPRNLERDADIVNEAKAQCDCTTTITKVKTAHGKVTQTAVVTKIEIVPGPQVTYTSVVRTKTVSSVLGTGTAYFPVYSTVYVTIPASSSISSATSNKSFTDSSSLATSSSKSRRNSKIRSVTSSVTSSTTTSSSSSGLVTSSTPLTTTTSQSTSSSTTIPSSSSSSTTFEVSPPKPTITSGFRSCSTIPSEFWIEVQGFGFASLEIQRESERGAYMQAANSSSTFFIDNTTSALSYMVIFPSNSASNRQLYSCSNFYGSYNYEGLWLAPKNSRCSRGIAKFTLADDCSITVSDNVGKLQPIIEDYDGAMYLIPFEDLDSYSMYTYFVDAVLIAQPVNVTTNASSTSKSSTISTSSTSSTAFSTTTRLIATTTSSVATSSNTSTTSSATASAAPTCSTPPTNFTLQVSGLRNGSIFVDFSSGAGYGYIVDSIANATTLTIDPATSALSLAASPGRNMPISTWLSCSDTTGGYEWEGLSFQPTSSPERCNRGWAKFALAADCTLSVSDDDGELVVLMPKNTETFYLVIPDYVDQFAGYMEPATLTISAVA